MSFDNHGASSLVAFTYSVVFDDDILISANATIAPTSTDDIGTPLTDTQEIILSLISLVTGTLSILGSTLIILMVFASPRKTSYKRILLGLSITDAIASLGFALSPFLLPADTSHRFWASGTDRTCSFLGFLYQFSFSAIWYNGMLSYYYLFTIRYGVSHKIFAKKYEPWMHILSLGFCLSTAIVGVAIGLFDELYHGMGCWVSEYPDGCDATDTCIGPTIAWIIGGAPNLIMFLSIPINNFVIFQFVKRTTQRLQNFGGPAANRQHNKKVNAVATQALFYVAAFFLSYIWTLVLRILGSQGFDDESKLYPLLVLAAFFHPLQGVTNCFVYSRPNYMRNRKRFPKKSRWWALKRVWFEKAASPTRDPRRPHGGSSSIPNTRTGTTEWFAPKSSVVSSMGGSIRRERQAPPQGKAYMDDYSICVNRHLHDQDMLENERRIRDSVSAPSVDPQSSGGDLDISSNDTVSRGLMSSLADIIEEDEETTDRDASNSNQNLQSNHSQSGEKSQIRRTFSNNRSLQDLFPFKPGRGEDDSSVSLEQSIGMGSLKSLEMESLAAKLHRSFGGLLALEDYEASLGQKGSSRDVFAIDRQNGKAEAAEQGDDEDVSGSFSEY